MKILKALAVSMFVAAFLCACNLTKEKCKCNAETMKMLKSGEDIVISAKTGEIIGSDEDRNPQKVKCEKCGFPKGSLRQRLIIDSDSNINNPETMKMLKEHKDLVISGRTGEIKGSKADKAKKSGKVECGDCGFPKGSLRERVIMYEEK